MLDFTVDTNRNVMLILLEFFSCYDIKLMFISKIDLGLLLWIFKKFFGLLCVCVCVHACSAAQLCLTLSNPKDCSPPGSSLNGISQARTLGWVAISSSKGCSQPKDQTSIFLCLLHWSADSLPLHYLGRRILCVYIYIKELA